MSDYSEQGAQPVEDASVPDPPTVSEVAEAQRRDHPEQAPQELEGEPGADQTPPVSGPEDGAGAGGAD